METFAVRNLTFYYPEQPDPAIRNLSLTIEHGEFLVLCGPSGCGKTTLLRQFKSVMAPHGRKTGEILFEGQPLDSLDQRAQTERIGFVQQSPENQIVTDKVWHVCEHSYRRAAASGAVHFLSQPAPSSAAGKWPRP